MGGPELIKSMNRQRVLQAIRVAGPLSRADLAERTGLTRPTISTLVAELLEDRWVREIGPGASSGGRRPIMLEFNPAAYLAVGAEISAGHVRAVLADLSGQVVARIKERVSTPDPAENLERVAGAAEGVLAMVPPAARVAGIGFALSGLVDREHGTWRYSPHFPGPEQPVAEVMSRRFGLPVTVENDARCLALGEYHFGAGRSVRSLVAVRVGVGIGAGILLDGALYTGVDQGSGELGHVQVVEEGPRCACGRYGCLEAVAGAGAVARAAVRRISLGRPSLVTGMVEGELERVMASDVIVAAADGDAVAREVLAEAGRYLGVAIGNLINLLNPELVVVGGGTARAGEFLLGPLREAALARALPVLRERVRIQLATQGEDAAALGAAALRTGPLLAPPALALT